LFVDAIYFILCHNWKNDLYQCIALNFYEMYLEVNSLTVRPLITVITVVFNSVNTIEKTILSVIEQTYDDIEYLIIDGGSTDGTLDIIRKFENKIDYWESEKDFGIYDAMNKGVNIANGKWVNFMNAGDLFYSKDTIKDIFNSKFFHGTIIYGNVHIRYEHFSRIEVAKDPKKLWRGMQFSHQSIFCDLNYLKKNLFNIENLICADLEFFYKAYKDKINFEYTPFIVSSVEVGGISESNPLKTLRQSHSAVINGGALPIVGIYYFLKSIETWFRSYLKSILPLSIVKKIILNK
jgi:glycosyltransferase involved in cell wall biosynthesis